MTLPLILSFRSEVSLVELSDEHVVLESPRARVPLNDLSGGMLAALRALSTRGATEGALSDLVLAEDGAAGLAPLYYYLQRFRQLCLLCHTLVAGEQAIAVAMPMTAAADFQPAAAALDCRLLLSRFACYRRDGDSILLESPRSSVRFVLPGLVGSALAGALAQPRSPGELSATVPAVSEDTAAAFGGLLLAAGMAGVAGESGSLEEDADSALRQWDFHDLLFHSRSRTGRHDYRFGGTFRFLGALPPQPALKPHMAIEGIALPKPDLERLAAEDMPLTRALECRRSVREYGQDTITLEQLGEFLYRSAGVRQVNGVDQERGAYYETSNRPYPSGGATYDIELYLSISRCDAIDPGLYHYDPLAHQLERMSDLTPQVQALLHDARGSAGLAADPPVLITLASRFQRVSWKYQSIAYSIVLKNAGVLYQTMYLVATAMNLAPCGLGGGNADLFAQAAGLNYYVETSVGEFMLGTHP